jgi:hypothetical protein
MTTLDDSEATETSEETMINIRKMILSKSVELTNSSRSIMSVSGSKDLTLNKDIVKLYKLRLASYNSEMTEYQIQRRAMIVLIDYIHDTITSDNVIYIRIIESHS